MKKILTLLIAFFTLFTLPSCNKKEQVESSFDKGREVSQIADGTSYTVYENGFYNSKYEVAIYIDAFHKLPSNYFKKSESSKITNEWTPENKYSVGGNVFSNREEHLPLDRTYTECDINSTPFDRGAERIVFSNEFEVYYTGDHYHTFIRMDTKWK